MKYGFECGDCGFVWELEFSMNDVEGRKKINKCPECNCNNINRIINMPEVYVRGNCYLDKEGARRDMNLHTMRNCDPYASTRQRGEADDLIHKLETGGRRKTNLRSKKI